MKPPKLSIIIVNWNTKQLLKDCLTSITKNTKQVTYEIIVVDNHSTDDSLEMLYQDFPEVTVITNQENLGFAKANNIGLKKAKGDYLLLLNSDTKINHDVFTQLVNWLTDHPEVGACGPKLLNTDSSLQPSAGYLPSLTTTLCNQTFPLHAVPILNRYLPALKTTNAAFYQATHPVGWVSGAAFLLRREIFEQIGGLDENIFMYVEEVEWCKRIHDSGYQIWLVPTTTVWHLEGGSSTTGKRNAIIGIYKGLYYYFKKHKPSWQLPVLQILLKLGALLRIPRAPQIYTEALKVTPQSI